MDYLENKGVYALVMHLPKDECIQIGKLGRFDFEAGWYVYLGSAHGSGGIKARANRHRRNDEAKRKRWNIDFLRPHVEIHEIWFAAAPAKNEHLFANVVSNFVDATVPVKSFGSQDCGQCDAHLFRLGRRPVVTSFRSMITQQHSGHPPICVEPVASFASLFRPGLELSQLEEDYVRGSTLIEMDLRRRANRCGNEGAWDTLSCACEPKVWKDDIEQLAKAMQVSFSQLKKDVAFAVAVDTIVKNCPGPRTIEFLLRGSRPQSRDAIMKLSRTSSKRQAYRMNGVMAGAFRSVASTGNDPTFDTISYSEVVSRLARARGTLEHLRPHFVGEHDFSVRAECRFLIEICRASATALRDNVLATPAQKPKIPRFLRKEALWDRLQSREVTGQVVGRARAAVRLTIKSLWDWPGCHRLRLLPTPCQISKTDAETSRIIELADEILSDSAFGSERCTGSTLVGHG